MASRSDEERWRAITYRRAEVLARVRDGLTDSEIASDLGISVTTVRTLLRELMILAGARDRRELGRWWRARSADWLLALASAGGVDCAEVARRWLRGELATSEGERAESSTAEGRNRR